MHIGTTKQTTKNWVKPTSLSSTPLAISLCEYVQYSHVPAILNNALNRDAFNLLHVVRMTLAAPVTKYIWLEIRPKFGDPMAETGGITGWRKEQRHRVYIVELAWSFGVTNARDMWPRVHDLMWRNIYVKVGRARIGDCLDGWFSWKHSGGMVIFMGIYLLREFYCERTYGYWYMIYILFLMHVHGQSRKSSNKELMLRILFLFTCLFFTLYNIIFYI